VERPTPFTDADKYVLEIAEQRVALELDDNKTFQQKAALLMAAVGFFVSFIGQMLLKLVDGWRGHESQWVAMGLLVWALAVLLGAAFCLLSALFGDYLSPAQPGMWKEHLDKSREFLSGGPHADEIDQLALHHLQHGYLASRIRAAEKAASANASKSKRIELGTYLLRLAAPFVLLAVVAFLIQAVAVSASKTSEESPMAKDKPTPEPSTSPADSGGQGGGGDNTQSRPNTLPSPPRDEISRKSADDEGIVRVDYDPRRSGRG
jgi:hypothetical protein